MLDIRIQAVPAFRLQALSINQVFLGKYVSNKRLLSYNLENDVVSFRFCCDLEVHLKINFDF